MGWDIKKTRRYKDPSRSVANNDSKRTLSSRQLAEAVQALNIELRITRGIPSGARFSSSFYVLPEISTGRINSWRSSPQENKDAQLGRWSYRAALPLSESAVSCFKRRIILRRRRSEPPELRGTWNGKPFESISDTDPRIGGA